MKCTRKQWTAAVVVALGIGGNAHPQIYTDTFTYPAGTRVGNWVEFLRDWQALGTLAESQVITNYQYMTQPSISFKDGCAQCDVTYGPRSVVLQFAGVSLRTNDPGMWNYGADLVQVKFQGSLGFNQLYLYENSESGSVSWVGVRTTRSQAGTVRLLAIDNRVVGQVDVDQNGSWDYTLTKTVSLPPRAGPIGVCGYAGSRVDNYKAFNGVILPSTTSPAPNPGNTIVLDLRGPSSGIWVAALSFGNSGIALANGTVPLTPDPLFFLSASGAFPGLSGVFDGNGDATLGIPIPNSAALVGTTFYTAFVSGTGITVFSNDHRTTIS